MKLGTFSADASYASDLFRQIPGLEIEAIEPGRGCSAQRAVDALEEKSVTAILAAESFDEKSVTHKVPLIAPSSVMRRVVSSIAGGRSLGVIVKEKGGAATSIAAWKEAGAEVAAAAEVAPGAGFVAFADAALKLKAAGAEMLVLESMAYSLKAKKLIQEFSGLPVIAARSAVASVVNELYGSAARERDLMAENVALAG